MAEEGREESKKRAVAIVLAAGQGKRMQSDVAKQFLPLGGKPLICYSLDVFEKSDLIDEIILVTSADAIDYCRSEIVYKYGYLKVSAVIEGGKERYHSVLEGLHAANHYTMHSAEVQEMNLDTEELGKPDYALIHDGARPFVTEEIIERNLEALKTEKACVTGMPSKDTVKISGEEGYVADTPNRSTVWSIQTPQSFDFSVIYDAYRALSRTESEVLAAGIQITDDAMVVEHFGKVPVKLVEGSYENIKITTPEDLDIAEILLKRRTDYE